MIILRQGAEIKQYENTVHGQHNSSIERAYGGRASEA